MYVSMDDFENSINKRSKGAFRLHGCKNLLGCH